MGIPAELLSSWEAEITIAESLRDQDKKAMDILKAQTIGLQARHGAASSSTHRDKRVNTGSTTQTPVNRPSVSTRRSESRATTAVTAYGIVIQEKDPKGKGKAAAKEDEDMAIDPTDVPIPDDEDLDKEFEDLLKSPRAPSDKND
ncbi:hypothetical protein E4T56_gene3533 [Termitomyces sp. T112]|nr:hypothetical protein E4T56_gene3533 [Termitomyces sp. T112]